MSRLAIEVLQVGNRQNNGFSIPHRIAVVKKELSKKISAIVRAVAVDGK